MDVKEIIENFKYDNDRKFQKESVLEARKNKEEVTEALLKELENVSNNIENYAEEDTYIFPLYAMYLLAEFREKRAFAIIIKFITSNQEAVKTLLGDLITEDLPSILASTYDGNINFLYNIIEDINLNEYIRGAAFHALEILNEYKMVEENEIVKFIEKSLEDKLKSDDSIVISDFIVYISTHQLFDKIETVRMLYEENRVDIYMIGDYDQFIDDIYGNIMYNKKRNMIDDTVKAFGRWACFNNEKEKDFDFKEKFREFVEYGMKKDKEELEKRQKIGRNDLCYCGSGKKYKKCCMNKEEKNVITPADMYIEDALKNYPKEGLKKVYDEETINIDEKLYSILKHKPIPLWIKRNYAEEARRYARIMEEALILIKEKCEKENIKTEQEFNEKIAIHYTLDQIIEKYFKVIEKNSSSTLENIQNQKVDFLIKISQIIRLENLMWYIEEIIEKYFEEEYYIEDIEKTVLRLKEQFPEMRKYLNLELSKAYMEDERYSYEDWNIEKILKPIDECIEEFPNDTNLIIAKSNIYSDIEKPQYEKALDILKKALTDNEEYDKHMIYTAMALIYDKNGDEENAKKYQELAMEEVDEEVPF